MKRFFPIALLIVLSLCATEALAQTGTEYYPLGMGDFWVYKKIPASDSVSALDRREVAGFQTDGAGNIFSVKNEGSGISESYQWYRVLPQGKVILFSLGAGPDMGQALVNFDPPFTLLPEKPTAGTAWDVKMMSSEKKLYTACTFLVESAGETVTVPAGTFRNCLKVKMVAFDENGKKTGVSMHSYAKGVGEVLVEQVEPVSERFRQELTEYTVK
jgi:hypothetical protein